MSKYNILIYNNAGSSLFVTLAVAIALCLAGCGQSFMAEQPAGFIKVNTHAEFTVTETLEYPSGYYLTEQYNPAPKTEPPAKETQEPSDRLDKTSVPPVEPLTEVSAEPLSEPLAEALTEALTEAFTEAPEEASEESSEKPTEVGAIPGLTYEQPTDGVYIRGYFTKDIIHPYYYVPDEKTVNEILNIINNLETTELTPKWWEGKQTEPMLGYDLVYGDMWYVIWSNGIVVAYGNENPGYSVAPELTEKLQSIVRENLGIAPFDPGSIKNVAAARLDFQVLNGDLKYTQTVTEPAALAHIESAFSKAGNVNGLTACSFNEAYLTLTLAGGEEILLAIASDSCPMYVVNGQEFDYRPAELRGKEDGGWINILYKYFDQVPLGEMLRVSISRLCFEDLKTKAGI